MSSPAPNSTLPPQSNPVLTAYEGFVGNTPLVSRYIMTTLLITWIISFFIDLSFSVSNIPYFSLGHFEVYRILFSSLICSNLFSLVFAYFSFVDHGKRLEFSMGSAQFAWLFFSLGTLTNVVHIAITYTLYLLSNNRSWVFVPASGIWTVLFGLIAIECVKAPTGSQRKLFIISIPTMQYPVVLCCLFSLLGGIQLAYFVSLGIGYAYGFGYLDRTKVSDAVSKRWEDSFLASLARQEGWVVGHAATGSDAWNDLGSGGATSAGPVSTVSFMAYCFIWLLLIRPTH